MTDCPTPAPDDEADLRRRLTQNRATLSMVQSLMLQTALEADLARRSAESMPATVDEVLASNAALRERAGSLLESWASAGEEEARLRQAIALIATEGHTAALIQTARTSNTLADAANRQTAALVRWTKWLAAATVALALATVVLVVVTATSTT